MGEERGGAMKKVTSTPIYAVEMLGMQNRMEFSKHASETLGKRIWKEGVLRTEWSTTVLTDKLMKFSALTNPSAGRRTRGISKSQILWEIWLV